jgi:hypothetical protein
VSLSKYIHGVPNLDKVAYYSVVGYHTFSEIPIEAFENPVNTPMKPK